MKLYDSVGPNPRVVRMFMAEKGIEMPRQPVDLRKGENREAEHLKRNPHGQMPTLELDDGHYLSEITAICEYLEEKNPKPAMIGATAEERAECRMWTRRVDLNICEHLGNGYRFGEGLKFFQSRIPCAPEASPGLKIIAANRLQWLDGQMADGTIFAASASRWRTSCSIAGSISAPRSASPWTPPTPISRRGWRGLGKGLRRRRRVTLSFRGAR
jgi:glutathione S-transferase